MEASVPFYGAVGLLMSACFLASAGYATAATAAVSGSLSPVLR